MKKSLVVTIILLLTPLLASAFSVAELQSQLSQFMTQLATLQASEAQGAAAAQTLNTHVPVCPTISRHLSRGAQGLDVSELQKFLVVHNLLATENTTGFFGPLTEIAVKEWQKQKGIVSSGSPATTGYGSVGKKTRISFCATPVNPTLDTPQAALPPLKPIAPTVAMTASVAASGEKSINGIPTPQKDIGGVGGKYVLSEWPEPNSTLTVPWGQIARNFDAVVFSGTKNGLGDTNFFWTNLQQYNYPAGSGGFGLTPYFGMSSDKQDPITKHAEGIVSMYALLGGSYIGIDYTAKSISGNASPANLVREAKKWFNSTTGADAFLNTPATTGEGSYWYAQFPGILGCSLAALYGNRAEKGAAEGEPSLTSLCLRTIDTWHGAASYVKGSRSIPEFRYSGQTLVSGTLSNGKSASRFSPTATCGTTESPKTYLPSGYSLESLSPAPVCTAYGGEQSQIEADGAAGVAYLGLMGYVMTGKTKYKDMLDWGLNFLDSISFNPNYEILLPYGALAAARSNAEYGTNHDVHKYMNWIFSESHVRYFWTMLSGEWGGYPMYGLMGTPKKSIVFATQRAHVAKEYAGAAAPNSMWYPLVIAPIARYDSRFAAAIGKYLAHVRVNARLFYPEYAPYADPQTTKYIADTGDARMKLAIPYEALMTSWPSLSTNEPYAYGESIGWGFKTNLATYAGAAAGGLAALFQATDVPGINQIDLLITDSPRPNAYPTYLFYNPFSSEKEVGMNIALARATDSRLGSAEVQLYDSVAKTVVAKGAGNTLRFRVAPSSARVIAVIPAHETLKNVDNRLVATESGVVVDFAFKTAAPIPVLKSPAPLPKSPEPAMPPVVALPSGTISSASSQQESTIVVSGTTPTGTTRVMLMLVPASYAGATDLATLYPLQLSETTRTYGVTATPSNGTWSASYFSIPVGSYVLYAFDYTTAAAPLLASAPLKVTARPLAVATVTSEENQNATQFTLAGSVTQSPTTLFVMLAPANYSGATDLTTLYNLQSGAIITNRTYGVSTKPTSGSWSATYQNIPAGNYSVYIFDYTTAIAPLLLKTDIVLN